MDDELDPLTSQHPPRVLQIRCWDGAWLHGRALAWHDLGAGFWHWHLKEGHRRREEGCKLVSDYSGGKGRYQSRAVHGHHPTKGRDSSVQVGAPLPGDRLPTEMRQPLKTVLF